jgi:hypothetical protein
MNGADARDDYWAAHGCTGEYCPDYGLEIRMAKALSFIEQDEVQALVELMAVSDGQLYFNEARGALQAKGCGGRVVLHVAVNARMAVALRTLASRTHTAAGPVGKE